MLLATIILIAGIVGVWMYINDVNEKKNVIGQIAMLFEGNEYLEKGDLKKAFGIYGYLSAKKNKTITKQLNSLELNYYTDIPGNTVRVLSNNVILSELNDTTYQMWRIISADSISLDTTFTNIKLVASSQDYSYFAIYANHKLILYNSNKTDGNEENVLLDDTQGSKKPYFAFSKYGDYFSYYHQNTAYIINLNNSNEVIHYKRDEDYKELLKNLLYASDNKLFAYFDDNIYAWRNNENDSLMLDNNLTVQMNGTPWVFVNKDNIMYGIKQGLILYNLQNISDSMLVRGDFSKNKYIKKPSDNMIFLYSNKYFNKDKRYKDYDLVFYNLKEKKMHKLFGGDTIEHLSVNADYTKCLVGDKSHRIYLVDNNAMDTLPLPFLQDAEAYDISDDGTNVLFVKKTQVKIQIPIY